MVWGDPGSWRKEPDPPACGWAPPSSAPHQGRGRFLPPPRPPLLTPHRPSAPVSRGRENSDTWRLDEVDVMAEIRGGSLGKNESRGSQQRQYRIAPGVAPSVRTPGVLGHRAAASFLELVPKPHGVPRAARPFSQNFRNPKPPPPRLRALVPPLASALPLSSSARADPVFSRPGLA